jgi:hypothetical protein
MSGIVRYFLFLILIIRIISTHIRKRRMMMGTKDTLSILNNYTGHSLKIKAQETDKQG